jgi:hypothetical protein
MRLDAAALRRDIREAEVHIDRLRRRYLSGDELPRVARIVGHALSAAKALPR